MDKIRLFIYVVVGASLILDAVCLKMGWPTNSATMRQIDRDSGHLVMWMWAALWLHWFAYVFGVL